jgi:hypothetical protein
MCTGRDLIARVARARLTYAENLVSGDLLGAYGGVCARAVPACGVRRCGVGARRESGQRRGCGETVTGAAGGRCALVGSPLQRRGHLRTVCGRARGGLGDVVSSRSAGSDMRGRLGWCGVRWLFRGFLRRSQAGAWRSWGAGTLRKGS